MHLIDSELGALYTSTKQIKLWIKIAEFMVSRPVTLANARKTIGIIVCFAATIRRFLEPALHISSEARYPDGTVLAVAIVCNKLKENYTLFNK